MLAEIVVVTPPGVGTAMAVAAPSVAGDIAGVFDFRLQKERLWSGGGVKYVSFSSIALLAGPGERY
jgi:hypothetical protein